MDDYARLRLKGADWLWGLLSEPLRFALSRGAFASPNALELRAAEQGQSNQRQAVAVRPFRTVTAGDQCSRGSSTRSVPRGVRESGQSRAEAVERSVDKGGVGQRRRSGTAGKRTNGQRRFLTGSGGIDLLLLSRFSDSTAWMSSDDDASVKPGGQSVARTCCARADLPGRRGRWSPGGYGLGLRAGAAFPFF